MKTGTIVLIGAAGLAAYYFAQLGTVAKTVQIVMEDIEPQGLLAYDLVFNVQNVSNASVNLNAMTATVFLNGNSLGTVTDFTKTLVPGTSQVPVKVRFDLSVLNLPSTIMQLIQSSNPALNFQVTGFANINGFVVPFTQDQSLLV